MSRLTCMEQEEGSNYYCQIGNICQVRYRQLRPKKSGLFLQMRERALLTHCLHHSESSTEHAHCVA